MTAPHDAAPRQSDEPDGVTRRVVLHGAAVSGMSLPLLAACGGGSGGDSGSGGSGAGGGGAKIAAAKVPVGGGTILPDQQVVVTQPSKGEFKAFTAVCTHQGCTVNKVEGGHIICPCHGSEFSIADGKNTTGPNGGPAGSVAALAARTVTDHGGELTITGG
jgi:nitrite reductase/ring-hydroxylating ferredoxin subunit